MNTNITLTDRQVDAIYATISNICGASVRQCDDFAYHFPECGEYRFQGKLGFGGKIYADPLRVWVDCYPEDRTPERVALIEKANKVIGQLVATTDSRRLKLIVVDAMPPEDATKVMLKAVAMSCVAGDFRSVAVLLLVLGRYNAEIAHEIGSAMIEAGLDITPDPNEAAWIAAQPEYEGATS